MAVLQIYDKLLQFALFQGMSRDDLELVAGHTRFGFSKVTQGKTIVKEGDACTHLYFLINGILQVETRSDDRSYLVTEQMQAPYLFQPESVFGYHQRFTHTFVALTDTNFITIDKEEVVRLSEDFLVFRLNLLSIYANQMQKLSHQPWRRCPQSLRERLIRFFMQHSIYPAGPKMFHILMNQLANELNDSRLNVSRVLNELQGEGLLKLYRGRIEIPALERFQLF